MNVDSRVDADKVRLVNVRGRAFASSSITRPIAGPCDSPNVVLEELAGLIAHERNAKFLCGWVGRMTLATRDSEACRGFDVLEHLVFDLIQYIRRDTAVDQPGFVHQTGSRLPQ